MRRPLQRLGRYESGGSANSEWRQLEYMDGPFEKLLSVKQMFGSRLEPSHTGNCIIPLHREDVGVLGLQDLGSSHRCFVSAEENELTSHAPAQIRLTSVPLRRK